MSTLDWFLLLTIIVLLIILLNVMTPVHEGFEPEVDEIAPRDDSKTGPWIKHPQSEQDRPFKRQEVAATTDTTTPKEDSSLVWWTLSILQLVAMYLVKLPYEIIRLVFQVPYNYLKELLQSLEPIIDALIDLYHNVRKILTDLMREAIKMYRNFMNIIRKFPKILKNIMRQFMSLIGTFFKQFFEQLKGFIMLIVDIPTMLFDAFKSFIKAFQLQFFVNLFTKFFKMLLRLPLLCMELMINFTDQLDAGLQQASKTGAKSE